MVRHGQAQLKLISTKEIGITAVRLTEDQSSPLFNCEAIDLPGDELTQAQASEIFRDMNGKRIPVPLTSRLVGTRAKWLISALKSV